MLNWRSLFISLAALLTAWGLASGAFAFTTVVPPGSGIVVNGGHPEPRSNPKPLIEHFPLKNLLNFEVDFMNGPTPLTFNQGLVQFFDELGNPIPELPDQTFGVTTFDDRPNTGNTIAFRFPASGGTAGIGANIPASERIIMLFPFEELPHNIVPATVDIHLSFNQFLLPLSFLDIELTEYRAPSGQTYIYPMKTPAIAGGSWFSGGSHELANTGHRRGGLRLGSNNPTPGIDPLSAWVNQRYAYDIGVRDGSNNFCMDQDGSGLSNETVCDKNPEYYSWGEPIYAPADGVVVMLNNDYNDRPSPRCDAPTRQDCPLCTAYNGGPMMDQPVPPLCPLDDGAAQCNNQPTAGLCGAVDACKALAGSYLSTVTGAIVTPYPGSGNHVVLQHSNGEFSTFAHMMQGSNTHLACGVFVTQGTRIGNVGMSGSGSDPHLHFSTLSTPGPEAAVAENYPMYFNNVEFVTPGTTTPRRQLDVSLPTDTLITNILPPPAPIASNPLSPPGPVTEIEPNDTLTEHQSLTTPTVVEGTLETGDVGDIAVRGDGIEDIYRVNVGTASTLQVDLSGFDPTQNLDIYVLDEDLRVLNPTREGTTRATSEQICLAVNQGAYYVAVTNADPAPNTESDYFLDITNGNAPKITIPGNLDLGETCVGSTSVTTLNICNTGGDTESCGLKVTNIISSDPQFTVTTPSSGYPVAISSDFCFPFQVQFTPTSLGPQSATLTVFTNDPSNPEVQVSLSGIGTQPDLNIAIANSGDFGNVCAGTQADLNLTLFNQGGCNVTINSITSNNAAFELPANTQFPLVLSPDADFNYPIRFSPTTCNNLPVSGTITVNSDSPGEENLIISVQGTAPCPNLVLDPDPVSGIHAFPATVVDTTGSLGCYSERSVTVRNTGVCPATIDDISVTSGPDYTVTSPTVFPIILPPGEETLEARVRFTPRNDPDPLAPNAVLGTLALSSDDPVVNSVQLCGESVAKSGMRILVTDVTSGTPVPVEGVDTLTVQSKGSRQPDPINLMFTDLPVLNASVCNNNINYHVNLETLPSVGTTGSNPNSSYQAKAMEGNVQTSESFSLGQCEFRDFQLQLQTSGSGGGGICPLEPKGASCTLDSECCSGKCKGPPENKICK